MVPMPGSRLAKTVNDFIVLPLRMPALPSLPEESTHYLYLRANVPRIPTENTPREVFLVNLPIDATDSHIRRLFADHLGGARAESMMFDDTSPSRGITAPALAPKGKKRKRHDEDDEEAVVEVGQLPSVWDREVHRSGSTAVVTFVDKASADLAIKTARRVVKEDRVIHWDQCTSNSVPSLGLSRYVAHHKLRYPDVAELQRSVDDFMTAFAAREAALAAQQKRQRSEPDEDGFITVTRGGRNGPSRGEARLIEEESQRREKAGVKEDFYRFQVREKRKAEAKDLVKGFEDDVKRMGEMRRRRGKMRPE